MTLSPFIRETVPIEIKLNMAAVSKRKLPSFITRTQQSGTRCAQTRVAEKSEPKRLRKLPRWMPHTTTVDGEADVQPTKKRLVATCNNNATNPSRTSVCVGPSFASQSDKSFLVFDGAIECIRNAAEADFVCEEIIRRKTPLLGFDIEWKVTFTHAQTGLTSSDGLTALVQLCVSSKRCYLFHVRSMKMFPCKLKEILESPDILKLGVGTRGDSSKLDRDHSVQCQGLVDLSQMANEILRSSENWSLKGLVLHLFHMNLAKNNSVRISDWETALTPDQKVYAATDAYAGLIIYQKLQTIQAKKQKPS